GNNAIGGYDRVREIGFRAAGLSYIPRRYCVARAAVIDPRVQDPRQKHAAVIYTVVANAGIIGILWGVEWCVVGFDRNHAYEPDCAVLKPVLERWIGEYKHAAEYGLRARF